MVIASMCGSIALYAYGSGGKVKAIWFAPGISGWSTLKINARLKIRTQVSIRSNAIP